MDNTVELVLAKGFFRLSGEKRAEILGMAKALAFAQLGSGQKAASPFTTVSNTYGRDFGGETGYAAQRVSTL